MKMLTLALLLAVAFGKPLGPVDDRGNKYSYEGCFNVRWDRTVTQDVSVNKDGIEECRDYCLAANYKYFGFECPQGKASVKLVHCECSNDLCAHEVHKDMCRQYNRNSSPHCKGPFEVVDESIGTYLMGAGGINSAYSVQPLGFDGPPNKGPYLDECDVCGGDGTSCKDCNGVANGPAVEDECGVCEGDDSACKDCAGIPNGGAVVDQCGICGGKNDCLDCAGVPNGDKVIDQCGVCGGDDACLDCDGVVNGKKVVDQCGKCGGDNSCLDCDGKPNGGKVVDQCGICGGENKCLDCDGIPNGDKVVDQCGICGGKNACLDCHGVVNGGAKLDKCGKCGGNNSCLDCDGKPWGRKVIDQCGKCGGDNSCLDCDGVPNGGKVVDKCGKCGGDNECVDCDGVVNGGKVVDQCGVCGGDDSCLDCDGKPNGGKVVDQCGICGGKNKCVDCAGVAFGGKKVDKCGVCGGDNSCVDCDGIPDGGKVVDQCGICGGKNACLDCNGKPNGGAVVDLCGECGGANTCLDCNGKPNGGAVVDQCGKCGGYNSCLDCDGVPHGGKVVDRCGKCGGHNECVDCDGVPNGGKVVDQCGVCGGDDSSCKDCNGIPNGLAVKDECGVCGGDGSSCKTANAWKCADGYRKCSCTGTVYYGRHFDTDDIHDQKTRPLMDFQKMYAMDKYTTHESIGSIQCEPKYFDDPNRGDDRGFIQGCWCEHKPEITPVECGRHYAPTCGDCPQRNNEPMWCARDCEWTFGASLQCIPKRAVAKPSTVYQCSSPYRKCSCTGRVYWGRRYEDGPEKNTKGAPIDDFETMLAIDKYATTESEGSIMCEPASFGIAIDSIHHSGCWCLPKFPITPVKCGIDYAPTCGQCPQKKHEPQWCAGDCEWNMESVDADVKCIKKRALPTNAQKCAEHGEYCSCDGTVYRGRKFKTNDPDDQENSPLLSFEGMIALDKYSSIEVQGSVRCYSRAFGVDPDKNFKKSCWCAPAGNDVAVAKSNQIESNYENDEAVANSNMESYNGFVNQPIFMFVSGLFGAFIIMQLYTYCTEKTGKTEDYVSLTAHAEEI